MTGISRKKLKSVGDIILIYSMEPNITPMKNDLTIPTLIKQHFGIYSGKSGIDGIRMDIYKWCGTDRVSILWIDCTKATRPKAIGKMEMHYTELYNSIGEMLNDREYLTNVMVENGWGLLDLRDLNTNREFGEDFC